VATGIMFFVSVFFAPIFASIPPWATGSALVIVGCLMIRKYVRPSSIPFGKHVVLRIEADLRPPA
jgi:xanthine/uracil/vitamin C permease (AzgA family)